MNNERKMKSFRVRFVISKLSAEEFNSLQQNQVIITKMLLSFQDFEMFHYKTGDAIEVETVEGNRLWCTILNLEIISHEEQMILIFTLMPTPTAAIPEG